MLGNPGGVNPLGHKLQGGSGTGGAPIAAAYYPSPNFQNHIEQLEQEYDAQADMVEDQDAIDSGPGPYPEPLPQTQPQINSQQIPQAQLGHQGQNQNVSMGENSQGYPSMTQLLDPYDPMLDMDPFGLSASMQFPSSFSFDTSSMR